MTGARHLLGIVGAALFLVGAGHPALAGTAVLQRVVIVERHGVRSPTEDNAKLNTYSDKPWPQWPTKKNGDLTQHGADGLLKFGTGLRRLYTDRGLFSRTACATPIFIWSDGKDSRTIESGEAVARGLNQPSPCPTTIGHKPLGMIDPLFDPVAAGYCPMNAADACASVKPRLEAALRRNAYVYAQARRTLQTLLTPGWKDCDVNPNRKECEIAGGENLLCKDPGTFQLAGPLALGQSLSENILLEYGQDMPAPDVAWGGGDPATIARIMPLHNLYSVVMRSDRFVGQRHATLLMQEILDALAGVPSTFKGSQPVPKNAGFVLFLGHDTNLANLAGLMGVSWDLPGEPDATGPAAAMAFELWRGSDGAQIVQMRMYYPRLEDLRTLAVFGPAHPVPSVDLPVPGCKPGTSCSLGDLKAKLSPWLAKDCLKSP
jgi:4-phytase/acid phosphatase